MRIVEITALPNGAHRNQDGNLSKVPDGWAMIPEGMEMENFPFGEVTAEEVEYTTTETVIEYVDGEPTEVEKTTSEWIMTVTGWVPGVLPEPEVEEPTTPAQEDIDAMLIDHEYRLTLLELDRTE